MGLQITHAQTKFGLREIIAAGAASVAGIGVATAFALQVGAAPQAVEVTPTNQQGWSTADTRPGGDVNFVSDATAPIGSGALQLTTDATTAAKAQYLHAANTSLANLNESSYFTKQNSASFPGAAASYQLPSYLNGGTNGFTTLVFEPYQNPVQGPVVAGVWQDWDVDQGLFWSSRTVACSNGVIVGAAGGPAAYTLAAINAVCPSAVLAGFGVNIGTFNPSYDVQVDALNFNGTTYNFEEKASVATSKDQCKDGGYMNFQADYKNQGQCVSSVANKK